MAVLLPDLSLTVAHRSHPFTRDDYNNPVAGESTTSATGPYPGAAKETDTDNTWRLRLDPSHWPVEPGDEVTDGTRVWVVVAARRHWVPGIPDVDHVAVTATLDPPEVP